MIELAGREHDWAAFDSLSVLAERTFGGSGTLPISARILRAAADGDGPALSRLIPEAAREPDHNLVFELVATAENPTASRTVVESMLSRTKDAGQRMWLESALGVTELAAGRWRAGARALERARDDATSAGLSFERERILWTTAACAALPALPVPNADVAAMREGIARWDARMPPPDSPPNPYLPLRPHLRLYLLGALDVRLGALDSAARHATALEQLPSTAENRATTDLLARVLRASIAEQRGEHTRALDLLEHTRAQLPMSHQGIRFVEVHAHWLRAEALRALHRDAEAIRWFHTLTQGEEYGGAPELALMGPSLLRQAELRERLGDTESARRLYARFADLWADADPDARQLVRAAAQRAGSPRDSR
jgi:hypothetical protein